MKGWEYHEHDDQDPIWDAVSSERNQGGRHRPGGNGSSAGVGQGPLPHPSRGGERPVVRRPGAYHPEAPLRRRAHGGWIVVGAGWLIVIAGVLAASLLVYALWLLGRLLIG